MIYRIDNDHIPTSEEKILQTFFEHGGQLSTDEIRDYTRPKLNRETIKINCNILIKKGVLYDKPHQKGKYRLVESAKLPTFLSFRTRNKTLSLQIMKDLFSSSSITQQNKLEQFANNIGMYILYVLIERIKPEGPWTANRFKEMIENDPRMKDMDILRDSWIADTIDSNFLIEQFNKYVNNENQTYQELVQTFESTFSNKIVFHERADKMRKLKKKN